MNTDPTAPSAPKPTLVDLFSDLPEGDAQQIAATQRPVHPFEAKGLGTAPFMCVNMRLGGGIPCDFCGTHIVNEYIIKSSDGRYFTVGSDCVSKTDASMQGFRKMRLDHERRVRADKLKAKAQSWAMEHKAEVEWIEAKRKSFAFAASLSHAMAQYGSLTEGQLAAVRRCMISDSQREERFQAEVKKREERTVEVNLGAIAAAFAKAFASGLKRPKLRVGDYKLSLAPATGRNPGAIYVAKRATSDEEEGTYLGLVRDGRFTPSRECTPAMQTELTPMLMEPAKAAVEYGRLTGHCAICGRFLENKESVDRGIGPICAAKFGW